jgi:hypothetical protein
MRDLLPESVEPLLVESSLEEGAGIDAGGRVALEEDLVSPADVVVATEEVVEAHFVEGRRRGIRREVSTDRDPRTLGTGAP